MERVREKRKSRREKSRRKKIQVREKVGKSRNTVFPMVCGSGGSKSRLAKAVGAEPAGQMRDEKLHAVVARSTCPSQNVQNTSAPDHFWKLRCRKSALVSPSSPSFCELSNNFSGCGLASGGGPFEPQVQHGSGAEVGGREWLESGI